MAAKKKLTDERVTSAAIRAALDLDAAGVGPLPARW